MTEGSRHLHSAGVFGFITPKMVFKMKPYQGELSVKKVALLRTDSVYPAKKQNDKSSEKKNLCD